MKKNGWKLVLDLVMFLVLMLLFNKLSFGITFHEIAGLALFGAFLLHLILNADWIKCVTLRLFDPSLPARTRIGYLINALLLIAFFIIVISGMLISKTLFSFGGGRLAKTIHYFTSAVALVLMGIHVGLHFTCIKNALTKQIHLPRFLSLGLAGVLIFGVLGFGAYSLTTTNFTHWLTLPFIETQTGERAGSGQGRGGQQSGAPPQNGERPQNGKQFGNGKHLQEGAAPQNAQSREEFPEGNGPGGQNRVLDNLPGQEGNSLLLTFLNYLSICVSIAIVTAFLDRILKNERIRQ